MEGEAQILCRFGFEGNSRPFDRYLSYRGVKIAAKLRPDKFAERGSVPALAYQKIMRCGERLQPCAKLRQKAVD